MRKCDEDNDNLIIRISTPYYPENFADNVPIERILMFLQMFSYGWHIQKHFDIAN